MRTGTLLKWSGPRAIIQQNRTNMVRTSFLRVAISLLASAISGGAANEFKFEVLSIKPVKRGPGMQIGIPNPTPNGFTATAHMNQLVAFAYGPPAPPFGPDRTEISNLPNWSADDVYVINALVSQ